MLMPMGNADEAVGQLLKEGRHQKGLSLRALAGKVNATFPHLSKVESGAAPAGEGLLEDLAEVLDLDLDELLLAAERVPGDLADAVIEKADRGAPEFLRTWRAGGITDEDVRKMLEKAKRSGA